MSHFDDNLWSPELRADTQAIIAHITSGGPLDPEVARRVRERAERIREETYRKHGVLDIGVPAIRELRGELPEPPDVR